MLCVAAVSCGGSNTDPQIPCDDTPLPDSTPSPDTSSPPADLNIEAIDLNEVLGNGLPTLADFGRSSCIPCKTMKSILEDLAVQYWGKLNVLIVNVDDHGDLTRQYEIMTIPTQILFDGEGNQLGKHIGVWHKEDIVAQLQELGLI
jgi:thioredoxin 1